MSTCVTMNYIPTCWYTQTLLEYLYCLFPILWWCSLYSTLCLLHDLTWHDADCLDCFVFDSSCPNDNLVVKQLQLKIKIDNISYW